ncbi:hypothetical protein JN00_0024 [Metamycoplasma subdolum]|uniref:Uncharacterized protein n=1 Tax=Metamycoplasma subdolum TaxID=92407 RepID=A0A3M0A2C2_9BACT|nr:hypothetical protein [Metamycoplasma subdolum]RMA78980.1 hypothetical protein JN00_0024 [Metamycoplasma subdolum]WPB50503.1 hypothetical protein R9C05_02750 [Metamycoplasma subdolum]
MTESKGRYVGILVTTILFILMVAGAIVFQNLDPENEMYQNISIGFAAASLVVEIAMLILGWNAKGLGLITKIFTALGAAFLISFTVTLVLSKTLEEGNEHLLRSKEALKWIYISYGISHLVLVVWYFFGSITAIRLAKTDSRSKEINQSN